MNCLNENNRKYYDLEKYLFGEVRKNFHKHGQLSPKEFLSIVIWKSRRAFGRAKKNTKKTVHEITRSVYDMGPKKRKEIIKELRKLEGVGIPMVSALLTVLYPNDFTVVDFRAKRQLIERCGLKLKYDPAISVTGYLEYVDMCKRLKGHLTLREFDKLLWATDWKTELDLMVEEMN